MLFKFRCSLLLDWLPSNFPIVKRGKWIHAFLNSDVLFSQTVCPLIFPYLRGEKWILLLDWLPSYFPIVMVGKMDSCFLKRCSLLLDWLTFFSHIYERKNGFFSQTGCPLIFPQLRREKWILLLDWLPSYFPIVKKRKMDSSPRLVALLFSRCLLR